MPQKAERKHCAYCRAILFEEDDVVWCPECGAPHHRACYQELGHCARADRHGLPEPPVEEEAPPVEEEAPEPQPQTPPTEGPANPVFGSGSAFDPYNGVDPAGELDGVPTTEVATFVGVNTRHYLPRFRRMADTGKKVSWNTGGFLFGYVWLFYRKCYVEGFAAAILTLVSQLMSWPLMLAANNIMEAVGPVPQNYLSDPVAFGQYQVAFMEQMQQLSLWAVLLAVGGMLLSLAVHLLLGLLGTQIYRRHCIAKVKAIRENEEIDNKLQALGMAGGVNLLIATLALYGMPLLLNLFLV